MKKKKYLTFYKECMKTGILPEDGLCYSLGSKKYAYSNRLIDLFEPTPSECSILALECKSTSYWASGLYKDDRYKRNRFTPLRQTIILFAAAMNKEL